MVDVVVSEEDELLDDEVEVLEVAKSVGVDGKEVEVMTTTEGVLLIVGVMVIMVEGGGGAGAGGAAAVVGATTTAGAAVVAGRAELVAGAAGEVFTVLEGPGRGAEDWGADEGGGAAMDTDGAPDGEALPAELGGAATPPD